MRAPGWLSGLPGVLLRAAGRTDSVGVQQLLCACRRWSDLSRQLPIWMARGYLLAIIGLRDITRGRLLRLLVAAVRSRLRLVRGQRIVERQFVGVLERVGEAERDLQRPVLLLGKLPDRGHGPPPALPHLVGLSQRSIVHPWHLRIVLRHRGRRTSRQRRCGR